MISISKKIKLYNIATKCLLMSCKEMDFALPVYIRIYHLVRTDQNGFCLAWQVSRSKRGLNDGKMISSL